MKLYYYTDKLLFLIAILNIWLLVPSSWGAWWTISLLTEIQGSQHQMLFPIVFSFLESFIILIFATIACFKRWRWVIIPYVLYLSYLLPMSVKMLVQYWKENNNWEFLSSTLYGYTSILIWVLGVITILVMLIETDYPNLWNRWCRGWVR